MGKAVLTLEGHDKTVDYLYTQMKGKDAFKDFKIEEIIKKGKIIVLISDINMDGKRL